MTPEFLDHLILGASDLASGMAFVEQHTGVRAAFGGVHPGRGTQNALLSLGPRCYLEILAPDPRQQTLAWFRSLPELREPRLQGWMVHVADIDDLAHRLRGSGIPFDGPHENSRVRPDGCALRWKLLRLSDNPDGLLPIFIEWSADSPHPADSAPAGLSLISFELISPEPEEFKSALHNLGMEIPTESGPKPMLKSRISGPRGELELASNTTA